MSIEFFAAINKERLPDAQALNAPAQALNLPLEVDFSLSGLTTYGFQLARFAGRNTGVEVGVSDMQEVRGQFETFDEAAGSYDSVVTFAWGSNAREGAVALASCAALCKSFGALVYSSDDAEFLNEFALISEVKALQSMADDEEAT
ncbi:MAG: hypothetical protein ACRED5_16585 [Propylenella sp.]